MVDAHSLAGVLAKIGVDINIHVIDNTSMVLNN